MSTLEIKDLHVSVSTEDGPKEILKGVTLTIGSGQTHAIMGPNGSGKSTLAYSIAGHPKYTVTSGSVVLDGTELTGLTDRQLTRVRRKRVGFVFQSFNLLPQLTAYENIVLPVTMASSSSGTSQPRLSRTMWRSTGIFWPMGRHIHARRISSNPARPRRPRNSFVGLGS